ncbi:hypothetical protein HB435_002658 [Salmonella enterica subsp. enterica serovar Stanley]|nr:hypothetical protein [Salmonella enterica subsp. enterica serovar Stanley]
MRRILKSENRNWRLLMIPAMAVLVAPLYFIGHLGYADYNWTRDVGNSNLVYLTVFIAIGYSFIVYRTSEIAFIILSIQFFALVLMLMSLGGYGLYGLWDDGEFNLSESLFNGLTVAVIFLQTATVLPLLITRR